VPGNRINIYGLISNIKKIITKSGRQMLFIKIEDLSGRIEVIVFPNTAEQNSSALEENKTVLISGRIDIKDNNPKLIAEQIEELVEE